MRKLPQSHRLLRLIAAHIRHRLPLKHLLHTPNASGIADVLPLPRQLPPQ
jgi:hypothetical protein